MRNATTSLSNFVDFIQVQGEIHWNPIMKRHTSASTSKYDLRPKNEDVDFKSKITVRATTRQPIIHRDKRKPYCYCPNNNEHSILY